MSKLFKQLQEWKEKGLISEDQLLGIKNYEDGKPKASWVLTSVLVLGALCIGLGIISVIAANWAEIPDTVKLVFNFLLLSAFGYGVYFFYTKDKPAYFESALFIFAIHCLATIGLTSQIYHLKGEIFQGLGLWTLITIPTVRYARTIFLPVVWSLGLLVTLIDLFTNAKGWGLDYTFTFVTITLIFVSLVEGAKYLKLPVWAKAHTAGLMFSSLLSVFSLESYGSYRLHSNDHWPLLLVAALALYGLIYKSTYNGLIQKRLKYFLLLTYLLMFLFHMSNSVVLAKDVTAYTLEPVATWVSMVTALFTLLMLVLLGLYFISLKYTRAFNCVVALIGIRIFILYVQALGGLATTGLGLISSGIVVLLLAYLWTKQSSKFTTRVQGWLLNE
ncbi:MAG: DUF2157 domain-containing protein [Bdellovibrionaceae bacterium]|nr:DUF2157 domain-containing protein [Pseudobdellovibrionaceae bacterium]